jgi:hypothetical protein
VVRRFVFAHDDRPVRSPPFRAVHREPTIFFFREPLQKFNTSQSFYDVRDWRRRSWPHLAVTVHHGGDLWLRLVIELACHVVALSRGIRSEMHAINVATPFDVFDTLIGANLDPPNRGTPLAQLGTPLPSSC